MMKWIGQHIWDYISRFRNDVYLEDVDSGTIVSGGNLGLDSNNKIVKIIKNLAPWRITGIYFKAKKVLEIKGGQTPPEIRVGDTMELIDV